MQHQIGTGRSQIQFISLEDRIGPNNPVRVIDAFVEGLPLKQLGFKHVSVKAEGRPPYNPAVMLKLYLYGYSGGVRMRSSRRLEAESKRNVELMWLIEEMSPSHMSIAGFRTQHVKELKSVFKHFGLFLKGMELIGGETVAIDSTKIRGVNSKGNNHTEKEVREYLEYLNEKSDSYLKELDLMDKQEAVADTSLSVQQEEVKELLAKLKVKKERYSTLQTQMKVQKATQLSTTDADTRFMQGSDGGNMVGFNIQSATDARHSLIADFEVTNTGDRHALLAVATSAKETLNVESLTVIADKGYHSGTELAACEEAGIVAIVAAQNYIVPRAVPDERYNKEHFLYDNEQDCYTCPEGHRMSSNGTLLRRDKLLGKEEIEVFYKDYKTIQCALCPVRHLCTTAVKGRVITRFEYQDAVDANNKRVKDNPEVYRIRKCTAEHSYGTIKRSWGYNYTSLKGIDKVGADMALIFTCYNMKRAISIMGVVGIVEALNNIKMKSAA